MMDRNNHRPNLRGFTEGSNKSSINYSLDSFRSSGAINSSFGISGSALAAAQRDAVITAERERIRLIKEEQARNAQKKAAAEKTYVDLARAFSVEKIRKNQQQKNKQKKSYIKAQWNASKSVGSIGMKKCDFEDDNSETESSEDEDLRRALVASLQSPGLRPRGDIIYLSDDSDYSSDAEPTQLQASAPVFSSSLKNSTHCNDYIDEEEEEDIAEEEDEEYEEEGEEEYEEEYEYEEELAIQQLKQQIQQEEEEQMRKRIKQTLNSSSPSISSLHFSVDIVDSSEEEAKEGTEEYKDKQTIVPCLRREDSEYLMPRHMRIRHSPSVDELVSEQKVDQENATMKNKATEHQAFLFIKQQQRLVASSSVKSEPYEAEGGTEVVIRMPNGSRFCRRFRWLDTIRDLKNYIESKADESGLGYDYEITSDFPKKTFHDQPPHTRLHVAGFRNRNLLHIKEV